MKASEGLTRLGPSILLFVLFCLAAACQALGMRHAEMGSSYLLVLGLEAVSAFALGMWFFGDPITPGKLAALALILAGVALLRQP